MNQYKSKPENWIYPTSFNRYILKVTADSHGTHAVLENIRSRECEKIKICFTPLMYCLNEETIIYCDKMEAKDGGKPYLFLLDIIKIKDKSFNNVRFGIRFELARALLSDPSFIHLDDVNDTYRLRTPPLFHVSEIDSFFNIIMPNFYAYANGARFFSDMLY